MKLSKSFFFLALALSVTLAHALEPWVPTDSEMKSLPPFCKARFTEGSAEYKRWESLLGADYGHTHHYCAAVNFLNRYYRDRTKQAKAFNLNNARSNFEYMVTHAAPSYSLMPEIYLNLGTIYSLMNQTGKAITHFNKAIELNPRQPRAYNALADYYAKNSQTAKALEAVYEGLRHNPGTKSLQRRYTELGGRLPYPEPIEPMPVIESVAEKRDEPATPAPAAYPGEPSAVPAEPVVQPGIGSPTNPYCRFCPD